MRQAESEREPRSGLLLDLDGVFYVGERLVPGARETVGWLDERGINHLYVTNTTSRPRAALVEKLARLGISVGADAIHTPPVAAAAWLRERRARRIATFVPVATEAEFGDFEICGGDERAPVDAVVVGDLGEAWTFPLLNRAFRLLMGEPQPYLVALGMTRYWRAPDGLRLDTAPFVAALAHASGVAPTVLGKPAAPFFEAALVRIGCSPDHAYMVGDDLRADVGGAQAAGVRGILVRTGKYRGADADTAVTPYAVLDSIADLPAWWESSR